MNIKRWINVEQYVSAPPELITPQAPRQYRRFKAFTKALGIKSEIADQYWTIGIMMTRSWRIREGHQFHKIYTNFLLDPDTSQTTCDVLKANELQRLLVEAMQLVGTVTNIQGDTNGT